MIDFFLRLRGVVLVNMLCLPVLARSCLDTGGFFYTKELWLTTLTTRMSVAIPLGLLGNFIEFILS